MVAAPKKQAQSQRLHPTQAALKEAILRAHYQGMVWNNERGPDPELLSPQTYGWTMDKGMLVVVVVVVVATLFKEGNT